MDANTIQTLVAGLGFPIVCVIGLAVFGYKVWEKSTQQAEKREERSYEVLAGFKQALDGFNSVLDKYNNKLDDMGSDMETIKCDIKEIKEYTCK